MPALIFDNSDTPGVITTRTEVDAVLNYTKLHAKKDGVETCFAYLRHDGVIELQPNQPDFGWPLDAGGHLTTLAP